MTAAAAEVEVARRPGRKRKRGHRYASGGLVPERQPDDRIRTARQPHRRALPDELRLDERAESPLGRLCLNQVISEGMYDAGVRYAVVVGEYAAVVEAPSGTAGSGRGFGCAGDCGLLSALFGADKVACVCAQRKRAYDAAHEALVSVGRELAPTLALRAAIAAAGLRDARPPSAAQIGAGFGQRVAKAVNAVAIWRQAPAAGELVYLKLGLAALARHFGLTGRGPRGSLRNTN